MRSFLAALLLFAVPAWPGEVQKMALAKQVVITGTSSSPQDLLLSQAGWTFIADGAAAGVRLPGSAGGPNALAVEYHFVVRYGADLTVFPFGDDSIVLGSTGSGSGATGGYLLASDGLTHFTLRASLTGWGVVGGTGVIGVGDNTATPETRLYRSAFRDLIQTAIIPAQSLDVAAASSAPTRTALGLSFAAGATNDLGGLTFIMPADWEASSSPKLFLHYAKTTSAAGTTKWQFRYRKADPYVLTAWSSWADFDTQVLSDSDTAEKQAIVSFPAIDMSLAGSPVYGRALILDVRRVSSGGSADTYAAAAVLLALGVHYESDIPGWRSSFTK